MENDISKIEKRVQQYWYTDGISELIVGGVFILLGLFFAGKEWLPEGSLGRTLFESSLAIVLIGGALAARWLINYMKIRMIYPRTGYVSYRIDQPHANRRRILGVITGAVVAALVIILAKFVGSIDWLPGLSGVLIGFILVFVKGKVSGMGRFYILAAFSVLLGFMLSFSGLLLGYRLALLYGLMGLAFLFSGGITLRGYLSQNPLLHDSQNE